MRRSGFRSDSNVNTVVWGGHRMNECAGLQ